MIAKRAIKLACERPPYALEVDDDSRLSARTLIIATGAQYRRPRLDNLAQFEGAGVHYLATAMEAQLCAGDGLAATMSKYLIRRIEENAAIVVRTQTEIVADDLTAFGWPLKRQPYLLETSRPGVFAVGDVRARNVKRVASALGEGSIAVSFIHKVLQRS
jgi:thioredoxin reductase